MKDTEDNDDDDNDENDSPKNDFWNLSNDEYYNPRLIDSVGKNLGSLNLQHATPAVELSGPLFPTHLNATKLRHFHRPTIKKVLHGKVKAGEYHPVHSIQKISETRAAVDILLGLSRIVCDVLLGTRKRTTSLRWWRNVLYASFTRSKWIR